MEKAPDLPLVEQEVRELQESLVQGGPAARGPAPGRGGGHQRSVGQEA